MTRTGFKSLSWRTATRIFFLTIFIAEQACGTSAYTYQVAAGDVLGIDIVLRGSLADLSKLSVSLPIEIVGESVYSHHSVTVTPDGFIFLPGLPPLQVQGTTLGDIEQSITSTLHLPSNQHFVSVALTRTNSLAFHIWGEVKQPGRYLIDHPTTLIEAMTYAGGPTEHARLKKVTLLRVGQPALQIDLSEKHLKSDGLPTLTINSGDTIIVSRKWTISEFAIIAVLTAITAASAAYVAVKAN